MSVIKSTFAPRILVYQELETETSLLAEYLESLELEVLPTKDRDVISKLGSKNFDLCILDVSRNLDFPGYSRNDELRLLKYVRKIDAKVPVIMLSCFSDHVQIINAYNAGADDCVEKPFNIGVLGRKIFAVLKRCGTRIKKIEDSYKIGDYVFDTVESTITYKDAMSLHITTKESRTLALLCAYKGEVLPKKVLLENVWADDNYFTKRSLDVYICGLRKHLSLDDRVSIETKRGIGYSLEIKED